MYSYRFIYVFSALFTLISSLKQSLARVNQPQGVHGLLRAPVWDTLVRFLRYHTTLSLNRSHDMCMVSVEASLPTQVNPSTRTHICTIATATKAIFFLSHLISFNLKGLQRLRQKLGIVLPQLRRINHKASKGNMYTLSCFFTFPLVRGLPLIPY